MTTHTYATSVQWEGSTGVGYRAYSRAHTATAAPATTTVPLSADAAFRGDSARLNPEQLLVVAASSCQLLSFLAVAAQHKIDVRGYADDADGVMDDTALPARIGRIVLRPVVTVAPGTDAGEVVRLAHLAHDGCYIANSLTSQVELHVTVVGA